MGLQDAYQEGTEMVSKFMLERPLEPPPQSLELYSSETIIFVVLILIGYLIYRKLRHRLVQPINRISFLILVPGYILSATFTAHDMAPCWPLKCRPSLWSSVSAYFSYDSFQIIIAITVASFIVAFFFNETVMRLIKWIKHG